MNFSYDRVGKGAVILLLHGWGLKKEKYKELIERLSKSYEVVSLDFPIPDRPWGVSDYARYVVDFVMKMKIKPAIILGHSLGGRVAIKLVADQMLSFDKLILMASAGIERKSVRVKLLLLISGLVPGWIKRMVNFGSRDYRRARGVMKETMKLVVGENLETILIKIRLPTLLVWGRDDRTTPLWQGRLMEQRIGGSKLVVIEGDHGIPYRRSEDVAKVIMDWLR